MKRELDFVDEYYKDKDLTLLKKVTLVIPTYNRTFYLSRCLWYHAHFPFKQIIVADSSPEETKVRNREIITQNRNNFGRDIVYLEYEQETETYGGDIYRKWFDAVAHSKSDFLQICTDKEFIIPTVSIMGVKYLTENPEYICAFGIRLEFIKSIITKKFVAPSCTQSFDEAQAIDRLNKLIACHSGLENMFQLYRSDIKKMLDQNIIESDINDLRYGEIAIELQPLIYGKVKQFDIPGRVRDFSTSQTRIFQVNKAESSTLRYPSLLDYPSTKKECLHGRLIQCFSRIKPKTDTSNIDEVNKVTKKIIEWWMEQKLDGISLRCKSFISKQLPDSIRKILAIFENTSFTKSPNKKTVKKELNIIKKVILGFML